MDKKKKNGREKNKIGTVNSGFQVFTKNYETVNNYSNVSLTATLIFIT